MTDAAPERMWAATVGRMNLDELLDRATTSFSAKIVYADPVEKDGLTVIPAARVTGGGGGGSDQDGQRGEGGGLGLMARPAGAYVIRDGNLRWEPAVDVNRLIATGGAVAIAALLMIGRIVGSRRGR